MELDEVMNIVKNIGINLIGQTGELAPADKKIYALRDSIACVRKHAFNRFKHYE